MNTESESFHDDGDQGNREEEGKDLGDEVDKNHEKEGSSASLLPALMDESAEEDHGECSTSAEDQASDREDEVGINQTCDRDDEGDRREEEQPHHAPSGPAGKWIREPLIKVFLRRRLIGI